MKWFAATVALLLLGAAALQAQLPVGSPTPVEEKGTYLGVLFGPVTEALYDQLPQLPRPQGVLLTHILPDSPALADLRRHDIVLEYRQEKIRDCEHLAQLIQRDTPRSKVKLLVLRGGRETTVEVTLGLGRMLRIASANKQPLPNPELPRGVSKPVPPAAISVSATPLEQGKMKIAIEYYQDGTGRLRTLTCEGSIQEIDSEIQKALPDHERTVVQGALKRIRDLTTQKNEKQLPARP